MSIKFASHPHTILYQYDHSLKWSHLVADHQCTSFGQLFCTPVESSRILKLTQSNPGRVFAVAAFVGVTYDWALTFGQEVELIWRQRWSLITAVYLGARYIGILSAGLYILLNVPTISLTDTVSFIVFVVWDWMVVVVFAMLWVIIITRLHAMYQGSRRILIFLIVTFPAVNIFTGVVTLMITLHVSAEELILSGTYQCQSNYAHDIPLLASITWILVTVWEVLALCLAVWIAVKYFRDLRQQSAGGIIEVLMKTYVVYFASFVAVSFFHLILGLSPKSLIDNFVDASIVSGLLQILEVVQMSVLGPRLILGVREYHAKLVADSDAATGMTSITFQERVHISIGSGV
ncbi:uncharacterized protein HD556DRAFT_494384 [Suillus plorans]|uniref:DUF6533 domain-containing protein n=1 Tax=Suillus plorans TaxID=116603 RepID=A0A9P7J6B2_9AGAM|nr:uncharacterized protein HD556DRAFT_494384 [Suillus plorans]KAG1804957.1 hypothetical protein HD556DRAFT_494384 [Suillus plorans]